MSYAARDHIHTRRDRAHVIAISHAGYERPSPDMLGPLLVRYPDLAHRIRRALAGLPNPPLPILGPCRVCGEAMIVSSGRGRDRTVCSGRCRNIQKAHATRRRTA